MAGRSLAERQAARRRNRDEGIARAALVGLTLRCRDLADDPDDPSHGFCQGEEPGGSGCLCRCHDLRAAGISAGIKSAGAS